LGEKYEEEEEDEEERPHVPPFYFMRDTKNY